MEIPKTSIISKTNEKHKLLLKLTILTSIICLSMFLFPIIQICAQDEINEFCLSYLNIMASKQFFLILKDGSIASFNFYALTKLCFFLTFIFIAMASILTCFKKFNLSAACFFLASCCPLNILPTIGELKNRFLKLHISSNRIFIEILWPFFLIIILCITCCAFSLASISSEHLVKSLLLCFSCTTLFCLTFLIIYMTIESKHAITKFGFFKLIIDSRWNPFANQFGILNMIKASIFSTLSALIIGAPIGVLTAVFMAEMCPKQILSFLTPLIDLMSGIPSVVFGFFGMTVIVPTIKKIFYNFKTQDGSPVAGDSLLAVILVLTIMILPTIVKTSFSALKTVPSHFKEASFGLGANKIETIFKVCLPAAKTTIITGLILAFGRAIGETMAVIMVAGNIAKPPELLGTTRLLTTGIAINLSYASGMLKNILFFMGLVLLLLITSINILFNLACKKLNKKT